jgi:LysR family hydrogen peroxide-inducible transcriptional activator
MRRLPSLKQLQHLVELYHHQHFGRAADACFISQSTLSASINNLEDILESQLLERDHKTFLFTPLGEEVVRRSRLILQASEALTDYAKSQGKPMQGELRLGCIPTIAPFILREVLAACRQDYPDLKLLIREDTTDNCLKQLEEGKLDVIILALPYPTRGVETLSLSKDWFRLVLSKNWLNRGFEHDQSFWPDNSIFLLEKEHCLTGHAIQACHLKNENKINPFFATSLQTLTQLVASELGVTFLPQLAITSGILDGTNLTSLPLAHDEAYREIGLAWRSTSGRLQTFHLMAELVARVLKEKQK